MESGSPAEALAKETAEAFKEETGCEVIIDAVAYTGMYDKLSTEIKAKQAAHDVACMDVVWLQVIFFPPYRRAGPSTAISLDIPCG